MISQNRFEDVLEIVIKQYESLASTCKFVLCEGSDYSSQSSAFEFDLNRDIARNLGCPILILGNAESRAAEEAIMSVQISYEAYREKGCQVAGILLNKVDPRQLDAVSDALEECFAQADCILATIPYSPPLSWPTVRDVAEQLNAEILYGHRHLDHPVANYIVAAMQMQHALNWLEENTLVITPGDRGDVIVGAIQAHRSVNYPPLAGLLLSTGVKPEPSIARLVEGLPDAVPILAVPHDTYTTASRLKEVRAPLVADNHRKIRLFIQLFEEHVAKRQLENNIARIQTTGMTPKMFTHSLVKLAGAAKQHIVLPEGNDPRILRAASIVLSRGIADLTLLGQPESIRQTGHQPPRH
ncbi:MAG: phosphate acyltransferase [Synechococcus sp.]